MKGNFILYTAIFLIFMALLIGGSIWLYNKRYPTESPNVVKHDAIVHPPDDSKTIDNKVAEEIKIFKEEKKLEVGRDVANSIGDVDEDSKRLLGDDVKSVIEDIKKCPEDYIKESSACRRPEHNYKVDVVDASCPSNYDNTGMCTKSTNIIKASSKRALCPDGFERVGLTCIRKLHIYTNPKVMKIGCEPGFNLSLGKCIKPARIVKREMVQNPCAYGDGTFRNRGFDCYEAPSAKYILGRARGYLCPSNSQKIIGGCAIKCPSGSISVIGNCTYPQEVKPTIQPPSGWNTILDKAYGPCDAGYTKSGIGDCSRLPKLLTVSSMSCPSGYTKHNDMCYAACPTGYTLNISSGNCEVAGPSVYDQSKMSCDSKYIREGNLCHESCKTGYTFHPELKMCQRPVDIIEIPK